MQSTKVKVEYLFHADAIKQNEILMDLLKIQ